MPHTQSDKKPANETYNGTNNDNQRCADKEVSHQPPLSISAI